MRGKQKLTKTVDQKKNLPTDNLQLDFSQVDMLNAEVFKKNERRIIEISTRVVFHWI